MLIRKFNITPESDRPDDTLLENEWLLTNGRGSFAASTSVGVNTRKYHGLLLAAPRSPGERFALLAALADEVVVGGEVTPLACFEFEGLFHPPGHLNLVRFASEVGEGVVRFVYRVGDVELHKRIVLARGADAVAVRYTWHGRPGSEAAVRLFPLLAMRHYHSNRADASPDRFEVDRDRGVVGVRAIDDGRVPPVRLAGDLFEPSPDAWHRFFHRAESERGEDPWEELFTPGRFTLDFDAHGRAEFRCAAAPFDLVTFDDALQGQAEHRSDLLIRAATSSAASRHQNTIEQLVIAADDFVASSAPTVPHSTQDPHHACLRAGTATLLAGFPWFADWGRDAFISLPGLLLCTGREELAHGVLLRFAGAIRNGLAPNRFVDEPATGSSAPADYNAVDASLWFIQAAFAWAQATGRWDDLHAQLLTPIRSILDHYHDGADFGIGVDTDGLLACGDGSTQLTWMDAMIDGRPITPRAGKPVEVNALYGTALKLTADRLARRGSPDADIYQERYAKWRAAFRAGFVNPAGGLFDRIDRDGDPDASIRPNQLLAVSLDDSLLDREQQRGVVEVAREHLLTPLGMRTLAPSDPAYVGRCLGSRYQRDAGYHQGTVWAWLIGPFCEAYLRVHDHSAAARKQAATWLVPLIEHMNDAGIGQISEIFDGDRPHTPRGCFAQAWSVAEVLRVLTMIDRE